MQCIDRTQETLLKLIIKDYESTLNMCFTLSHKTIRKYFMASPQIEWSLLLTQKPLQFAQLSVFGTDNPRNNFSLSFIAYQANQLW